LSLLQSDQDNVFFFKNINITTNESNDLSIATFNMKLGFCQTCNPFGGDLGGDHEHLDRIVDMINTLELDVVSLQEVGYEFDTSLVKNQIKYIAERTNLNYAYGLNWAFQTIDNLFLKGFVGNAILSKYEILSVENPTVRYIDYYSQNHCLKVNIKLNEEKELILLNAHLKSGSTDDEKILQINKILEQTKNEVIPTIITGDFNISYTPNNPFLSLLSDSFSNTLKSVSPSEQSLILGTGTFITGSTIDYIFTSLDDFNIESGFIAPIEFRDISLDK